MTVSFRCFSTIKNLIKVYILGVKDKWKEFGGGVCVGSCFWRRLLECFLLAALYIQLSMGQTQGSDPAYWVLGFVHFQLCIQYPWERCLYASLLWVLANTLNCQISCCCGLVVSDSLWPHGLQHATVCVLHYPLEFAQIHVHWGSVAI